ncbi:MAG: hypothetical protein C3F17_21010 [Bradyrhizobiaceae bacterium]|nr:MAG: hypothetical protein C3F17_21010 [Bradyrhizobiaceae bacterium]
MLSSVKYALVAASLVLASSMAEARPVKIVAFGDSGIAGKGVSAGENMPAKLEAALRAKGYDVQVVNAGINGDTIDGALGRVGVTHGADIVIVQVGVNDLRKGASPSEVRAGMRRLVNAIRQGGAQVIVTGFRGFHGCSIKATRCQSDMYEGTSRYRIDAAGHISPAGYDRVVSRLLSRVEPLVKTKAAILSRKT